MRTLIKGGTIINADTTTRADVLVDRERIVSISEGLDVAADRTIDDRSDPVIIVDRPVHVPKILRRNPCAR